MEARLNEEALDVRGAEGMWGLRRGTVRFEQVRISIEPQHPRHLAKHGYRLKIRTAGNARDHAIEGLVGEGESLAVPALELDPAGDTPQPHGDVHQLRGRTQPAHTAFPQTPPRFLHQPAVAALDEEQPIPGLDPHVLEDAQVESALPSYGLAGRGDSELMWAHGG